MIPAVPARTWPALLLLGVASGLPNPLVDATLQTWLTTAGWSRDAVLLAGYTSLPYLLKPLWAPMVDRLAMPWLGRRRGWLAATQVAAMAALAGMALAGDGRPAWLIGAAVVAALASATQDLVVNAVTASQPTARLTLAAAWSVWGYRLGMVAALTLAPLIAATWGWNGAYLAMAALLVPGLVGTLLLPEPAATPPATWREAVTAPIAALATDHGGAGLARILAAVVLYRLADQMAGAATGRFLAEVYTLDQLAVGRGTSLVAAGAGAAIAAVAAGRIGMGWLLAIGGVAMAASNLSYVVADQGWAPGVRGLMGVLAVDAACGAFAGTVFVAWLMGLCRPGLAATQYALLSAVMTVGLQAIRPFVAAVADQWGWSAFFLITVAACLPGLLCLVPVARMRASR
jgi:PAT family beta-lactamase induction signal transducer AmpG